MRKAASWSCATRELPSNRHPTHVVLVAATKAGQPGPMALDLESSPRVHDRRARQPVATGVVSVAQLAEFALSRKLSLARRRLALCRGSTPQYWDETCNYR